MSVIPVAKYEYDKDKRGADLQKRIAQADSKLKPWNRLARAILKDYKHQLDPPTLPRVQSLAKQQSKPPAKHLDWLTALARKFGIEA